MPQRAGEEGGGPRAGPTAQCLPPASPLGGDSERTKTLSPIPLKFHSTIKTAFFFFFVLRISMFGPHNSTPGNYPKHIHILLDPTIPFVGIYPKEVLYSDTCIMI